MAHREQRIKQTQPTPRPPAIRPRALTGVAVVNLLIGGLVLLLGVCCFLSVILSSANGAQGQALRDEMAPVVCLSFMILMWGAMTIFTGFGLLKYRRYARMLGIVLAITSLIGGLLFVAAGILSQFLRERDLPPEMGLTADQYRSFMLVVCIVIAFPFLVHSVWNAVVLFNGRYWSDAR